MRTKDGPDEITRLPPPPAPTARDANPWPNEAKEGRPRPSGFPRRGRRRSGLPAPARRSKRAAVAIVIGVLLLGVVMMQLARGGDVGDLAEVALPLAMVAIFAITRLRERRRRGPDDTEGR